MARVWGYGAGEKKRSEFAHSSRSERRLITHISTFEAGSVFKVCDYKPGQYVGLSVDPCFSCLKRVDKQRLRQKHGQRISGVEPRDRYGWQCLGSPYGFNSFPPRTPAAVQYTPPHPLAPDADAGGQLLLCS